MTAPKGEDIVCASVSVLAHSFLYGLEHVLATPLKCDMRPGTIAAEWSELDDRGMALYETVKGSFFEIAKRYPNTIKFLTGGNSDGS